MSKPTTRRRAVNYPETVTISLPAGTRARVEKIAEDYGVAPADVWRDIIARGTPLVRDSYRRAAAGAES